MANAKRCDRCFEYYDHNNTKTQGRISGGIVCGIRTIDRSGFTDVHFDLCDGCLKKLQVWLDCGDGESDGKH